MNIFITIVEWYFGIGLTLWIGMFLLMIFYYKKLPPLNESIPAFIALVPAWPVTILAAIFANLDDPHD